MIQAPSAKAEGAFLYKNQRPKRKQLILYPDLFIINILRTTTVLGAAGLAASGREEDMRKIAAFLVYLLAFVMFLAMGGLFLGYWVSHSEQNVSYVYVGDLNVSGKTRDETEALLRSNGWGDRETTPLTVTTFRGERFQVDPIRSGVATPVETLANRAYAVGHDADMITNLFAAYEVYQHPVDITRIEQPIDTAYLDGLIDDCISRVQSNMGDEDYTVDTQAGTLTLIKGRNQLNFDRDDFRNTIITALRYGQNELYYNRLTNAVTMPDFDAIRASIRKEPADAYYLDNRTYAVSEEVVGCDFDVNDARARWEAANPGDTVAIPLNIVRPQVTAESLRSQLFRDLLGACLTKFPNSGENRRANLQLCAAKIDGYIVNPGEVFSYNDVVGERTEEAGFKPAPAYVDGAEKDEIGGGACQVSSTLYAATAFAFLETVERSNHVFKVSYMQRGTDATVTIPAEGKAIDFKFRNNKSYPVKIKAEFNNEDSTINVEVWGTLEDWDYMPVEFDNTYGWEHDYDRVIAPAYPDRPGFKIKFQVDTYGFEDDFSTGYRTITHRLVIDQNGNTVEDTVLNPGTPGNYAMDTYYQHPE